MHGAFSNRERPVADPVSLRRAAAATVATWNGSNIVAATAITGDAVCRATNVDYRVDTQSARDFLSAYVTLP